MLRRLLNDRVAVAEGRLDEIVCSPEDLYEEEQVTIRNAVTRRQREFVCGRVLARRAMTELGAAAQSLPAGPDRDPIWPHGLVGSITHSRTWCAAAVGRSEEIRSIGIDVEDVDAFGSDLWPTACTAHELQWLSGLPSGVRMLGATILFSAKETVFKAQYPLTQRMLGHQDVEIVVSADWCAWVATLTQAAGESHPSAGAMGTPETWEGRLLEEAGMVATCVVIPAR